MFRLFNVRLRGSSEESPAAIPRPVSYCSVVLGCAAVKPKFGTWKALGLAIAVVFITSLTLTAEGSMGWEFVGLIACTKLVGFVKAGIYVDVLKIYYDC